jgi:hypothetical protein
MRIEKEHGPRRGEPQGGRVVDPAWRDRIVELHVLVEHGDADAANAARQWLATDGEAQRMWDEIERDCRRVRDTRGPDWSAAI